MKENGDILPGHNTNVLLVKAMVGSAKPTTYRLPTEEHKYGLASPKRVDTVQSGKTHKFSVTGPL